MYKCKFTTVVSAVKPMSLNIAEQFNPMKDISQCQINAGTNSKVYKEIAVKINEGKLTYIKSPSVNLY